jgi:hypothetical protein
MRTPRVTAEGTDGATYAITADVTVTVTGAVATSLLEYAGLERADDGQGWRTRDGRESSDPAVALTDALVAIAEDDLAAEAIEGGEGTS